MGYEFEFTAIAANMGPLLKGAGLTLGADRLAAVISLFLSVGGAVTRLWGAGWARGLLALMSS